MTVLVMLAALASLAGAAGSWLCLRELRRRPVQAEKPAEEDDMADEALREGILNLLRYSPMGKQEDEEA